MTLQCDSCPSTFPNKISLGLHRKSVHGLTALNQCDGCKKIYKHSSSLSKHRKENCSSRAQPSQNATASNEGEEDSNSGLPDSSGLQCGRCISKFKSMLQLCRHLLEAHSIDADIKYLNFSNATEFQNWRKEIEKAGNFGFLKHRTNTNKTSTVDYYYCHRSGNYVSESQNIRAKKASGSIKAGFWCSAFAVVTTDNSSGNVSIKCCLDHYGHDHSSARMRLPDDLRNEIAAYIRDKRSIDWILDKLKDDIDATPYQIVSSRRNTLKRNDIRNVAKSFGLTIDQEHDNDTISVDLMVKGAAADPNNPFFFYNPEDETNRIFTLGIQTKFQAEIMKEFGQRVVCLDSTHWYKFPLITVMVIDIFGKGFPCAWLITKSESKEILTGFFKGLRERCGPIASKVFMSDDAPQYYKSWINGFCQDTVEPPLKLVSIGHVYRNWKQKLSKLKDRSDEQKSAVFRRLLILSKEKNEAAFRRQLFVFLGELKECGDLEFVDYFQRHYCSGERIKEWARIKSPANVNIFMAAFHCGLKDRLLDPKWNRRLDDFVKILLDDAAKMKPSQDHGEELYGEEYDEADIAAEYLAEQNQTSSRTNLAQQQQMQRLAAEIVEMARTADDDCVNQALAKMKEIRQFLLTTSCTNHGLMHPAQQRSDYGSVNEIVETQSRSPKKRSKII